LKSLKDAQNMCWIKRAMLQAAVLLWIFVLAAPVDAETVPTRLLFVGEDISVVTSASKHPESPENAPASCRLWIPRP